MASMVQTFQHVLTRVRQIHCALADRLRQARRPGSTQRKLPLAAHGVSSRGRSVDG